MSTTSNLVLDCCKLLFGTHTYIMNCQDVGSPSDINMHPESGAAPSPFSTNDDVEADDSVPPVSLQLSKAKGEKKAKL